MPVGATKIDVEGNEEFALASLEKNIRSRRVLMFVIEVVNLRTRRVGFNEEQLVQNMAAAGYNATTLAQDVVFQREDRCADAR